jgi:hypothetical protein
MGAGEGVGRLRFAVATSGFKRGTNKKGCVEYGLGLHLYSIGRLIVTAAQAQLIRTCIINECTRQLGPRLECDGLNPWDDVFDGSPYKGQGGTRMLGSCKVKSCTQCSQNTGAVLSIREEDQALTTLEKQSAYLDAGARVAFGKPRKGVCR